MNGHKSDFRKYGTGSANKPDSAALYKHLQEHGQSDFKFQIIDRLLPNSTVPVLHDKLNKLEREWIWKLDTVVPCGLNIDNGFHSQNRLPRNK